MPALTTVQLKTLDYIFQGLPFYYSTNTTEELIDSALPFDARYLLTEIAKTRKILISGSWKDIDEIKILINGSWKTVTDLYVLVSGSWEVNT